MAIKKNLKILCRLETINSNGKLFFSKAFNTADCTMIVNVHGFWPDDAVSSISSFNTAEINPETK